MQRLYNIVYRCLSLLVLFLMIGTDAIAQSRPLRIKEQERSSAVQSTKQPLAMPLSSTIDTSMRVTRDSAAIASIASPDLMVSDTAASPRILMADVRYKAKDFYDIDEVNKRAYFYNEAEIIYGDIKLNAGYIMLDYGNGIAYARGIMNDTLGIQVQKPVFTQGEQSYDAYAMVYDFNSERGYIKNVKTEQTEGYATGRSVRKEGADVYYAEDFYFSTDEKLRGWIDGTGEVTDYYIRASRAKMTTGKSLVTGFSQMYIADVPTPLVIPFAFFPLNTFPTSGVILPSYNLTEDQGFGLTGLGYYFVINDYLHMQLEGDIYTKGSWSIKAQMNYLWKYHFRGALNFEYSNVVIGEVGLPNYSKSKPWRLGWNHSQDSKWLPGVSMSASVNFSSAGYYEQSLDQIYTNNYIANTVTSSSINLSKVWGNSPFTTSVNISQSQNNSTGTMSLTLPNFSLSMNRIFPFRKASSSGKKWYEKINVTWNMNANNTAASMPIEAFMSPEMSKYMKFGVTHAIPIKASYNVLRHFNLNVGVNYNEAWNFKTLQKHWDEDLGAIVADTVSGMKSLRTFNANASLSTMLYGTFQFKGKGSLKAIRHVMNVSLGYTYAPDFSTPFWGYYYDVRTGGPLGGIEHFSYFDGGLGPAVAPTYGSMTQALTFSINNSFEAKVIDRSDTTGTKTKKVKLLDNFTIGGSYNFAAPSFKLSLLPISSGMSFLDNQLQLRFGIVLNPYKVDENYQLIDEYCFPRLTGANVTTSFNLANGIFSRNKEEKKENRDSDSYASNDKDSEGEYDPDGYMKYAPQWRIDVNQSFSYTKNTAKAYITNSLSLSASIMLSKKWSVTASTGFDFQNSKWADVHFGFARDLNTWQITFSWAPVSYYSNYSFFIGIKANMLKDLKYEQRRTFSRSIM